MKKRKFWKQQAKFWQQSHNELMRRFIAGEQPTPYERILYPKLNYIDKRRDTPLPNLTRENSVAPASILTWGWRPISNVESGEEAPCGAKENHHGE